MPESPFEYCILLPLQHTRHPLKGKIGVSKKQWFWQLMHFTNSHQGTSKLISVHAHVWSLVPASGWHWTKGKCFLCWVVFTGYTSNQNGLTIRRCELEQYTNAVKIRQTEWIPIMVKFLQDNGPTHGREVRAQEQLRASLCPCPGWSLLWMTAPSQLVKMGHGAAPLWPTFDGKDIWSERLNKRSSQPACQ